VAETGLSIGDVVKATGLHEQTIRRLERRGIISAARGANGNRLFPPSVVLFLRERYTRNVEVEPTIWEELANAKRAAQSPIVAQIDELVEKSLELPSDQLRQLVATLQRQDAERTGEASDGTPPVDLEVAVARRPPLRSVQGGRSA